MSSFRAKPIDGRLLSEIFAKMCSGSEPHPHIRLIVSCVFQCQAQGPVTRVKKGSKRWVQNLDVALVIFVGEGRLNCFLFARQRPVFVLVFME
jgi:hypothetical protein